MKLKLKKNSMECIPVGSDRLTVNFNRILKFSDARMPIYISVVRADSKHEIFNIDFDMGNGS